VEYFGVDALIVVACRLFREEYLEGEADPSPAKNIFLVQRVSSVDWSAVTSCQGLKEQTVPGISLSPTATLPVSTDSCILNERRGTGNKRKKSAQVSPLQ
jgi:hypothetical protein